MHTIWLGVTVVGDATTSHKTEKQRGMITEYSFRFTKDIFKLIGIIENANSDTCVEKFFEYLKICYNIRGYEMMLMEEQPYKVSDNLLYLLYRLPFCFSSKSVIKSHNLNGRDFFQDEKGINSLFEDRPEIFGLERTCYDEYRRYAVFCRGFLCDTPKRQWNLLVTPSFKDGKEMDESSIGIGTGGVIYIGGISQWVEDDKDASDIIKNCIMQFFDCQKACFLGLAFCSLESLGFDGDFKESLHQWCIYRSSKEISEYKAYRKNDGVNAMG